MGYTFNFERRLFRRSYNITGFSVTLLTETFSLKSAKFVRAITDEIIRQRLPSVDVSDTKLLTEKISKKLVRTDYPSIKVSWFSKASVIL